MAKKSKWKPGQLPERTPIAERDWRAETNFYFSKALGDVDESTPTNLLIVDMARYLSQKLDDVAELLKQQAKKPPAKPAAKKLVKRPRVRVSPLFKNQ